MQHRAKATPYARDALMGSRPPFSIPSICIHVTMSSGISSPCPYACLHAPVTALGQDRYAFVLGLTTAGGNPEPSTA